MVELQRKVAAIVQQDPNVAGFMSSVGAGGRTPTINQGRLFIRLKPQGERKLSADDVAREMQPKLSQVPGMRVYMQNLPVISIGGTVSKSLYQFTLQSTDIDALYQNAGMLETMGEDYVRTARAKGLAERRVVVKHGLRGALTPILTIFGLDVGLLLGGAVLTERVFSLPGLGKFTIDAITNNDLPKVMGAVLFATFFVVIANLVVDLLYAVIDPRVRLG